MRAAFAPDRRSLLLSGAAFAFAPPGDGPTGSPMAPKATIEPFPLSAVRLKPSIYADAVAANGRYLLELDPGRLLHNFYASAGLPTRGEVYGGWEARGIAGHTLGHYLSGLSLTWAQTGDPAMRARAAEVVAELARIQAAHGDGYVGGTTVERNGVVVDGKVVFEELRRGEIFGGAFDTNGGWVPLYTWHKVHAGLIDAVRLAELPQAMPVMLGVAAYLATILEGLDDGQMQRVLIAEHGGLNESYADTYAMTGDRRWLVLAQRIRDRRVLDALADERDILPGLHANTQIPKVIGLARLHQLTGEPGDRRAARFFHRTVTDRHSYVIGGNSEREHFGEPGRLAERITDRTCEACNSYNMLKLTRLLYADQPSADWFDGYERIHLNHIMAHQHPRTGRFAYFMPLASGARRTWSTADDSFWCCVGSGMESHAKHGDSIWWRDADAVYVNLFIASAAAWPEKGLSLSMETAYPASERVEIVVDAAASAPLTIALRLPRWCAAPLIAVNGDPTGMIEGRDGYARLERVWRANDRITLDLPMTLTAEATPDDGRLVAFLHGPVVLAADLGPADQPMTGPSPALVAASATGRLRKSADTPLTYEMPDARPGAVTLKPFFSQYDRRTAVYFPLFTPSEWAGQEQAFRAAEAERTALEARTFDVIHLGEMQPERDHDFSTNQSDVIAFGGRGGRQAWWGQGNFLQFRLAIRPGPVLLRAVYWGEEVDKHFDLAVEGVSIATERRPGAPAKAWVSVDYPVPDSLTRGKTSILVRIETRGSDAPVYEVRTLAPPGSQGRGA